MTVNINKWLNLVTEKLEKAFSEKLIFVGLQGSYGRGEAAPESDIDLVVILDKISFQDLKEYRNIIDEMPNKELACGFISGKEELQNWSKSDLFQFFYDTKPLLGDLKDIIQPPGIEDIKKSIKTSSETLYHAAVHSFVHSNNYAEDLKNLYKMTFFILQAKYFIGTNNYIPTKKDLLKHLKGIDLEILNICTNKDFISTMKQSEAESLYEKIIKWCQINNGGNGI